MHLSQRDTRTPFPTSMLLICALLLLPSTTSLVAILPSSSHIARVKVGRIHDRDSSAQAVEGIYGELTAAPSADVTTYQKQIEWQSTWKDSDFAWIESELSPAILWRSSASDLTFFGDIAKWGHAGPTHISISTRYGQKILQQGQRFEGATIQNRPWILAWFANGAGWTFDAPWLIVLQHKATAIELGKQGLRIEFNGPCGDVVSLPLYGYYKPPPRGRKWTTDFDGAVDYEIETWAWEEKLPSSVIKRCDWLSRVFRRVPIHCSESFSVWRLHDTVTLRSKFTYYDIRDDWKTKPITFAPLSYTLALALTDAANTFPMRFSHQVVDTLIPTKYGPYMGVEGSDTYDVEFETLQYINELERPKIPGPDSPDSIKVAFSIIQEKAALKWPDESRMVPDFADTHFCWAAMADRWYSRVLPFIQNSTTRMRALGSLRAYFDEKVLQCDRYTPYEGPKRSYRDIRLFHGPGVRSWGGLDDAGKFSQNLSTSLWSYGHYTGDWDLIRRRWDLIKQLNITPLECTWESFGRTGIAELGDEAPPVIQNARMAWAVGDIDTYLYDCYIVTRELLMHFVKQNGARYFRKVQPVASMEPIPEEVYLTNVWGALNGWQMDGPEYPAKHGERQFDNRWVRFGSTSTARFYRDHIQKQELRAELDRWASRHDAMRTEDHAHILPSLIRIHSLLLNSSTSELEREGGNTMVGEWRGHRESIASTFAIMLSFLRSEGPNSYDRLIPKSGSRSPFLMGLERSVENLWSCSVQRAIAEIEEQEGAFWPVTVWDEWDPPLRVAGVPGAREFSFGTVSSSQFEPVGLNSTAINWNSTMSRLEVRDHRFQSPAAAGK